MSVRALSATVPPAKGRLLASIAVLACALVAGFQVAWPAAFAIAALGMAVIAQPFRLVPAITVVVLAATFVDNGGGRLTLVLSLLTVLLLYTILCQVLAWRTARWGMPGSRLVPLLLLLEVWTIVEAVRGVAAGNSLRFLGLELLPLLSLSIALTLGGVRLTRRDLHFVLAACAIAGLGHVLLGVYSYIVNHVRRGGIFFMPVTGMLAMLTFNLLLRAESRTRRWALLLLTCAFLLHQVVSLTRGYWMGILAALPFSVLFYVRRGEGVGRRWRNLVGTVAMIGVIVSVGAAIMAVSMGWGNVAATLGARFASSLGTKMGSGTASNMARIVEWYQALRLIQLKPWLGYGLGYSFHVRFPYFDMPSTQWVVHETYIWMWLKTGLVGLVMVVAVMIEGTLVGVRQSLSAEGEEAGWGGAAAAATIYLAVLGLTNYSLAIVNDTFLLALFWGIALSLQNPARWSVVWRLPRPATSS